MKTEITVIGFKWNSDLGERTLIFEFESKSNAESFLNDMQEMFEPAFDYSILKCEKTFTIPSYS